MLILEEIYAIVKFLTGMWPLVVAAWTAYQKHRLQVESDEAAAKLKAGGVLAKTGDTSGLEKFFNPDRTYAQTPAQNPPTPAP